MPTARAKKGRNNELAKPPRSFHIILGLPLSLDDILEVEKKFSGVGNRGDKYVTDPPRPIVEKTELDQSNLESINESKIADSQVFNSRYFVDSLSKPVQGEQMPENVSTACWWDGFTFNGQPVGVPISQHEKHGYRTRGIYCSPQCAAAAIWNTSAPSYQKWEQQSLLHNQTGWSFHSGQRIKSAPQRFTLLPQGGTLTIEEFRELNRRRDRSHRVIYPPCTADTPIFEVNTQDEFTAENQTKHVPLERERVEAAKAQLLSQQPATPATPAATGGRKAKAKLGKKTLVSLMNLKIKEASQN